MVSYIRKLDTGVVYNITVCTYGKVAFGGAFPRFLVHKVVGLLLGAYAEVDARDKQQRTPLHLCSETGHETVVKVRDQLCARP